MIYDPDPEYRTSSYISENFWPNQGVQAFESLFRISD